MDDILLALYPMGALLAMGFAASQSGPRAPRRWYWRGLLLTMAIGMGLVATDLIGPEGPEMPARFALGLQLIKVGMVVSAISAAWQLWPFRRTGDRLS